LRKSLAEATIAWTQEVQTLLGDPAAQPGGS